MVFTYTLFKINASRFTSSLCSFVNVKMRDPLHRFKISGQKGKNYASGWVVLEGGGGDVGSGVVI